MGLIYNIKDNMEHIDTKKKKLKDIIQISFVVLIAVFLILMIFTVVKISKNIELLKKDPITYGIETSDDFSYCYCYDIYGRSYNFPKQKEEINNFATGNITIP